VICKSCTAPLLLYNGDCETCNKIISDCEVCSITNNNAVCTKCEPGYSKNSNGGCSPVTPVTPPPPPPPACNI